MKDLLLNLIFPVYKMWLDIDNIIDEKIIESNQAINKNNIKQ